MELSFRDWLEQQELDEGMLQKMGKFAKTKTGAALLGGALGGAVLGGVAAPWLMNRGGPPPKYSPEKTAAIMQHVTPSWRDALMTTGSKSQGQIEKDLGKEWVDKIDAARTQGEKNRLALQAGIEYAKRTYGVTDDQIEIVKPSDLLKKHWGKDYEKVLSKAKSFGSPPEKVPFMPDPHKVDKPQVHVNVAIVDPDDPTNDDLRGACDNIGGLVTVCPIKIGSPSSTRDEEATHGLQGIGDISRVIDVDDMVTNSIEAIINVNPKAANYYLKSNLRYPATAHEFTVKLASLKRWYYQHTGKILKRGDSEKLWRTMKEAGLGTIPENTEAVYNLMLLTEYADKVTGSNRFQKILDFIDETIDMLVRSDSGESGKQTA